MMRAEAIAFGVAGAIAIVSPTAGAVLLSCVALAPAIPPFPETSRHLGAAFVTAVVVGAGWLGVGIFQLIRHFPSPLVEHIALFGALVGLTVGAMRLGRPGDPEPERERAMAGFARSGFASLCAVALVILSSPHARLPLDVRSLKPLLAAAQPIAIALVLGLALERQLTFRTWRRRKLAPVVLLLAAVLVLAAGRLFAGIA